MALRPRIMAGIRTAVWIALTLFGSLINLVFSGLSPQEPTPYLFLSLLGAFTVPFVLIWRRRFPELVLVITVVAASLLSIGATTTWVALGSLIRNRNTPVRTDPWQWAGILAVVGVTYLAVHRDFSSPNSGDSMSGIILGQPPGADWATELPWYTAPVVAIILLAIVFGVISLARARAQVDQVSQRAAGTQERNLHLSNEIARYEERERIARELHDSLGNTLASVSMLSGAVRAQDNDPQTVSSHAEQLQHAAQEATAQMHEIVRTYRSHGAPVTTLADVHDLIARNQARGALIHAEVNVHDADVKPGAVERAVYRVVQELITNASKHAPAHALTLRISGGPAVGGVQVFASNPLPATPPAAAPSGGSGIIGTAERVEQLGGWLHSGVENGLFIVQVWVPWRNRPGA